MKKTLSVITAVILAVLMVLPAFAATGHTLTGPENGHKYDIYQIFTGEVSDGKVTNVKFGANAKLPAGKNIGDKVPVATLNTIVALSGSAAEIAQTIAADYADFTTNAIAYVDDSQTTAELPTGYYLVKDNQTFVGKPESCTLYVIQMIDEDVTLNPKAQDTTLSKTIVDSEGNELGKGAEANPGDTVYFKVEVNLSERMADYKTYKIVVTDTLSNGFTYNNDAAITVDGAAVTDKFEKTSGALVWTCDDVSTFASAGKTIVLTYSATLSTDSTKLTIGANGNTNKAVCEYSNNPYDLSQLGKTAESIVKIYNFNFVVNKVDENSQALTGATFKLSKYVGNTWTVVDTIDGSALSTFTWKNLTSGKYKLEEVTAPTGYKAIDPIEFEIAADIDADGAITYSCVNTDITPNSETGIISTTVMNNYAGADLPSTGGIGTIIFTVAGAVLVAAAVVIFFSKKKAESVEG